MSVPLSSIPEDAFYANPFGVDESTVIADDHDDHDQYCAMTIVRHRLPVGNGANTGLCLEWCPNLLASSIKTVYNVTATWSTPTYASAILDQYTHVRCVGAGLRFVPSMSQELGTGVIAANTIYSRYHAVGSGTVASNPLDLGMGDYPVSPSTGMTKVRDNRGYVEGSAMAGLAVPFRKCKYFNLWSQSSITITPTPIDNTASYITFSYDPDQFYPTELDANQLLWAPASTTAEDAYQLGMAFPRLCMSFEGMPATVAVWGTVELIVGFCGLARSQNIASRTPKPVFVGASLAADMMSNQRSEKDAKEYVLRHRAEMRSVKLWKILDTAGLVARSLALLGSSVNPSIGGGLMGASMISTQLASGLRQLTSG